MLIEKLNSKPLDKWLRRKKVRYNMLEVVRMSEMHYGCDYVYAIQYDLVWCVKYCQEILYGQIDIDIKELLKDIDADHNIEIVEMASDKEIRSKVSTIPKDLVTLVMRCSSNETLKKYELIHY